MKRQLVQIPPEQVNKLKEIDSIRPDMVGYAVSKKVHILLQEKLAELFKVKVTIPKEEIEKGKWFEYIRELIPTHIIAPIAIGVVRHSKEMIGTPFTKILVAGENDKTWWGNFKEDIYNVGDYLLPRLMDKNFSKDYLRRYKAFYIEVKKLCEDIRESSLSKLSNQKLLERYCYVYEKLKRYSALSFDIDSIDIVLEEKMQEKFKQILLLKNKNHKQSDFNLKYNILKTPSELSYVNEEQLEVYRLAQEIKDKKEILKLFEYDTDIINKRIEKYPKVWNKLINLTKKYWWTSLGWSVRTEKDIKSFIDDIKNILKENPEIEKELKRLSNFIIDIKKQKQNLSKELNFDSQIKSYLKIFEIYATLHDYRKEIQMKGTVAMNKFLFEISSRFGKKYDDLVWCFPSEIKELIKKGFIDLEKAEKRKEAEFILVTMDNIVEETGESAIKARKKELEAVSKKIRDFKGISASFGSAHGTARVCYSADDAIKKVKKGNILIASMTMPEYVPAMKKAAAIVTDEGGITCHAAIISRELKIPCVVGTRIATKVIQDNEQIEVNANHGVVKKIK